MTEHHLPNLSGASLFRLLSGFLKVNKILKNPRISLGSPANHHSITFCLLKHPLSVFPVCDVPVSDHWYGNRLFHLTDNIPVSLSGVILFPRPAVHSHCSAPGVLDDLRDLHRIDMVIIKTFADLHCYRLLNSSCYFGDNLMHQARVLHQGGAFRVLYDLWHRTPHINIKERKRTLFHLLCNLTHNVRIRTKELQRHRRLIRMNLEQAFCIFIAI